MPTARQKAEHFLTNERAFRLGQLLTESSHPKTATLSKTIQQSTQQGVRMLLEVDAEIPPAAEQVFAQDAFRLLVGSMTDAIKAGRRVFFTGCGATGRLSILLEAAWRRFWQELRQCWPQIHSKLPDLEDNIFSVMAGGDYALIRSVEGFEDFTDFGKYQLAQGGVAKGDVVVAITEGGETSFVIGTAWQGLEAGARVFFVYNNPTELLRKHVERSRRVIDEDRIIKLDLTTGPMAVAGSTRMQATSAELLVVGAALEMALVDILREYLSAEELAKLKIVLRNPGDYTGLFAGLLGQLGEPANVQALARWAEFEESIYNHRGLVTYMTDRYLLDALTDTTERAPTFCLPAFRKCDDTVSAPSWAFIKNPTCSTADAWLGVFRRSPGGLDWDRSTYRRLKAPENLQNNPPKLDNKEILKFQIGNELDASRWQCDDSALLMNLVGGEIENVGSVDSPFIQVFQRHAEHFRRTAATSIGPQVIKHTVDDIFHVCCELPPSPLNLWSRLAVKLVFNIVSTATMARMGRVVGNWMVYVEPTNKKLIDRGTRLISELAGVSYEQACIALHEAMDEVYAQGQRTRDAPSPVALVIERYGLKYDRYQ